MRLLCLSAIGLWVVAVGAFGWLFVRGTTAPGTDGRTEVLLAPNERDLILGEMRMLLKAVHGVVTGVSGPNGGLKEAEQAARNAGMGMAADVNPALMAKLPLPFKQMGMSIHKDMDALADAILQKETSQQILQRLSSMTARCTACHDLYRLSSDHQRAVIGVQVSARHGD